MRDTDDFLADVDELIEWHGSTDSASWSAVGSHETNLSGESYYADRQPEVLLSAYWSVPGRATVWDMRELGRTITRMWDEFYVPFLADVGAAVVSISRWVDQARLEEELRAQRRAMLGAPRRIRLLARDGAVPAWMILDELAPWSAARSLPRCSVVTTDAQDWGGVWRGRGAVCWSGCDVDVAATSERSRTRLERTSAEPAWKREPPRTGPVGRLRRQGSA